MPSAAAPEVLLEHELHGLVVGHAAAGQGLVLVRGGAGLANGAQEGRQASEEGWVGDVTRLDVMFAFDVSGGCHDGDPFSLFLSRRAKQRSCALQYSILHATLQCEKPGPQLCSESIATA